MAELLINKHECIKVFNKLAESNRKTISARIKIGQTTFAKLPIYLEIEKVYDSDDKAWYYTVNAVYNNKAINLYAFYNEDTAYQLFNRCINFADEQKEIIKILINEEVDINVSFLDK